jgi:3-hydroxyisobutyrate dehydrogenase/2-hydroxy-3-oxopropionate reductase
MGAAMAKTIAKAGLAVVVWNRDLSKASKLAEEIGATTAPTAAEAAARAAVVITSLADDTAVREVYLGPSGVVSGVRPGTVVIDTSTIDPETSREIGERIDETGAGFLDGPVSGSVTTVEAGALTMMMGGDPALIEQARPALEPIAARIIAVGGRGAGAATKLAVNALVHGLNGALAEALVLAERAGVDRTIAYDVFAGGVGGSPFVQYKREAYEHPESAPVAFSLDLVAKDLELITALARRVGVEMNQTEASLETVRRALEVGLGQKDMSAIAVLLRGEE